MSWYDIALPCEILVVVSPDMADGPVLGLAFDAKASMSAMAARMFSSTFLTPLPLINSRLQVASYLGRPRAVSGHQTGNALNVSGCTQRAVRAIISITSGSSCSISDRPSGTWSRSRLLKQFEYRRLALSSRIEHPNDDPGAPSMDGPYEELRVQLLDHCGLVLLSKLGFPFVAVLSAAVSI